MTILKASNASKENIIKTTVYLSDMAHYEEMNSRYRKYFEDVELPARVCIAVKALPFGVDVEIDCIAYE